MENVTDSPRPKNIVTTLATDAQVGQQVALYVIICFAIISVFLAITLIVLQIRRKKRAKIQNKELEETCSNDSNDNMNYQQLRTICDNIFENPAQSASLLDKVGTVEEDRQMEKFRETLKIFSCRYPDLQCLVKSEVQVMSAQKYTLHMNRFLDVDQRWLYLSQAPIKDEFPLFVQAIIDEKIGVVVWVGNLFTKDEKFEAYFPINRMGRLRSGIHVLRNIKNDYRKSKGYDLFELGISKLVDGVSSDVRKISVVKVDIWPSDLSEVELVTFAKLIKFLIELHESHTVSGFSSGVLFHCLNGVEESAAVAAIYLGYQIWRKRQKVNILGIMRYIRKHRHCAFTYNLENSYQMIPVIYGTLTILASRGDKI